MRLRLLLWWIEVRIAGLLVAEALLLSQVSLQIACIFPWYLWYQWYFEKGPHVLPSAIYLSALAVVALWHICTPTEVVAYDRPLALDLQSQPALARLCKTVSKDVRCAIPAKAFLTLSPAVWRRHGCDAIALNQCEQTVTIPIGCLAIWSILDFRCYIAHCGVRRRPPRWLFDRARSALTQLNAERVQRSFSEAPAERRYCVNWLAKAINSRLTAWRLVADIQADLRVSRAYGAAAVADFVQRTELAGPTVRACLTAIIEPTAKRGKLLPVADACRAWHSAFEPKWHAILKGGMTAAERAPGKRRLDILTVRLAALQGGGGVHVPHDPRLSATLFENLALLEEAAVRNELPSLPPDLERIGFAELGTTVVVPKMREDVARNADILKGKSIADIPNLLRASSLLAARYRSDPRRLLEPRQRQILIPQLLASFLTVELVNRGWSVGYTVEEGLSLTLGKYRFSPQAIIRSLARRQAKATRSHPKVEPD
jgi:hypothetical protein